MQAEFLRRHKHFGMNEVSNVAWSFAILRAISPNVRAVGLTAPSLLAQLMREPSPSLPRPVPCRTVEWLCVSCRGLFHRPRSDLCCCCVMSAHETSQRDSTHTQTHTHTHTHGRALTPRRLRPCALPVRVCSQVTDALHASLARVVRENAGKGFATKHLSQLYLVHLAMKHTPHSVVSNSRHKPLGPTPIETAGLTEACYLAYKAPSFTLSRFHQHVGIVLHTKLGMLPSLEFVTGPCCCRRCYLLATMF